MFRSFFPPRMGCRVRHRRSYVPLFPDERCLCEYMACLEHALARGSGPRHCSCTSTISDHPVYSSRVNAHSQYFVLLFMNALSLQGVPLVSPGVALFGVSGPGVLAASIVAIKPQFITEGARKSPGRQLRILLGVL